MGKPNVSFHNVNEQIKKATNPEKTYSKSIVDGQGILHTFVSHRDYLMYLDERDLELMGSKS